MDLIKTDAEPGRNKQRPYAGGQGERSDVLRTIRATLGWAWLGILFLTASMGLAVVLVWLHPHHEHFTSEHWLVREVSLSELDRMTEGMFVDARSPGLYNEDHIPGAVLLSEEAWDEGLPTFLEKWQPEQPVVIYCGGQACAASKRVALRLLTDLPEARIYVLKGGFPVWKAAQK